MDYAPASQNITKASSDAVSFASRDFSILKQPSLKSQHWAHNLPTMACLAVLTLGLWRANIGPMV